MEENKLREVSDSIDSLDKHIDNINKMLHYCSVCNANVAIVCIKCGYNTDKCICKAIENHDASIQDTREYMIGREAMSYAVRIIHNAMKDNDMSVVDEELRKLVALNDLHPEYFDCTPTGLNIKRSSELDIYSITGHKFLSHNKNDKQQ
jgi:hypothetical protein